MAASPAAMITAGIVSSDAAPPSPESEWYSAISVKVNSFSVATGLPPGVDQFPLLFFILT